MKGMDGVVSARRIQEKIIENKEEAIPLHVIRKLLRKHLGLRYRKLHFSEPHHNTIFNRLLRQRFGRFLVDLFGDGIHYIHIDESNFQFENYANYGWVRKNSRTVGVRKRLDSFTLVSAVSTFGKIWSLILKG